MGGRFRKIIYNLYLFNGLQAKIFLKMFWDLVNAGSYQSFPEDSDGKETHANTIIAGSY